MILHARHCSADSPIDGFGQAVGVTRRSILAQPVGSGIEAGAEAQVLGSELVVGEVGEAVEAKAVGGGAQLVVLVDVEEVVLEGVEA